MSMFQSGSVSLRSTAPSATGGNTSTFEQVVFPVPFPGGSEVVVIPMVQTFNGAQTPGVRIAEVTTTGFKIRMNELVTSNGAISDGQHVFETIGWVAFTV